MESQQTINFLKYVLMACGFMGSASRGFKRHIPLLQDSVSTEWCNLSCRQIPPLPFCSIVLLMVLLDNELPAGETLCYLIFSSVSRDWAHCWILHDKIINAAVLDQYHKLIVTVFWFTFQANLLYYGMLQHSRVAVTCPLQPWHEQTSGSFQHFFNWYYINSSWGNSVFIF